MCLLSSALELPTCRVMLALSHPEESQKGGRQVIAEEAWNNVKLFFFFYSLHAKYSW